MAAISKQVCALDGGWTWFNDPRAVYDATSNTLFYGYMQSNGAIAVGSWDFTRRLFLYGTPRVSAIEVDDHDNPALCVLDNGKILSAYSSHNGDSWTARSTNARDIRTWDTPVAVSSGAGQDDAYAVIFQMGNTAQTVYHFSRECSASFPNWPRQFRTSTDRGDTWSAKTTLVALTNQRPYLIARQNGANRIDFAISDGHPSEATNCSIWHFYMLVASDGTRTYFKTDGTSLGNDTNLPFAPSSLTQVYNGSTLEAWQWDLAIYDGNPVIAFATFESSLFVHYYHQARWSGSAWSTHQVCSAGTTAANDAMDGAASLHTPGIALDPNDVNTVYLSREYAAGDFRLEKWTHTGTFPSGTWAKDSDISGNTGTVNGRPYCPRGLSPTRVLWWEGTYTSFTNFRSRIRLYPAPDWRAVKASSPAWVSGYAPSGTQAYFLLNEGTGTAVADLVAARNGSFTGTPAWNAAAADNFGPYLNGFSTSNFVNLDTLAAALVEDSYTVWMLVLAKTISAGTTSQYLASFGHSTDTDPIFAAISNVGGATVVGGFWRGDAGTGTAVTAAKANANDGEFHVWFCPRISATLFRPRFDGDQVGSFTNNTGATNFNRGAIGVLRRSTDVSPFAGEIHAVIIGWGSAEPNMYGASLDLLQGQFMGTFDPDVVGGGVTLSQLEHAVGRGAFRGLGRGMR